MGLKQWQQKVKWVDEFSQSFSSPIPLKYRKRFCNCFNIYFMLVFPFRTNFCFLSNNLKQRCIILYDFSKYSWFPSLGMKSWWTLKLSSGPSSIWSMSGNTKEPVNLTTFKKYKFILDINILKYKPRKSDRVSNTVLPLDKSNRKVKSSKARYVSY